MYYNYKLTAEPVTSLEEVLLFIRYYGYQWDIWFNLLEFSDGVEFKSNLTLDFFKALLQLDIENAIRLDIKWQVSNDFWRKNPLLDKELSKYKWKESGFIWMLNWNNEFYDILNLRMNWDTFKLSVKYPDVIMYDISVRGRHFLTLLFSKITEELWFLDQDREESAKNLYKTIYEKTDNKNNYHDKVELYYKFEDYLDNRRLFVPILSELQEKGSLKIEDIIIRWEYIHFIVSRIIDISEKLFIETSNAINSTIQSGNIQPIERIEYTKEWVKINWKKWSPADSEKSEVFLLFLSWYFNENPDSYEILLRDFHTYYEDNLDIILEHIDKEKRLKYLTLSGDNIRKWYLDTISKHLSKEYTWDFLEMKRWQIIREKYDS